MGTYRVVDLIYQSIRTYAPAQEAAVTELRESLATIPQADVDAEDDEAAAFQAVSTGYVRELLAEIAGALAEETALCRRLAAGASALSGQEAREQHLLLSSTWTARPCVPEARLRSLKDAVTLELAS